MAGDATDTKSIVDIALAPASSEDKKDSKVISGVAGEFDLKAAVELMKSRTDPSHPDDPTGGIDSDIAWLHEATGIVTPHMIGRIGPEVLELPQDMDISQYSVFAKSLLESLSDPQVYSEHLDDDTIRNIVKAEYSDEELLERFDGDDVESKDFNAENYLKEKLASRNVLNELLNDILENETDVLERPIHHLCCGILTSGNSKFLSDADARRWGRAWGALDDDGKLKANHVAALQNGILREIVLTGHELYDNNTDLVKPLIDKTADP